MSTYVTAADSRRWARPPVRRIVEGLLLAAAVFGLVAGLRFGLGQTTHPARAVAGAGAGAGTGAGAQATAPMAPPVNPAIEQAWGIRFTNVVLMADGGMVELRYVVVNPATAGRIHSGGQNNANLPMVINEATGARIKPTSAMLHFHHGNQTSDGRAYSIVYGNAGNAVHIGKTVTIEMNDHSKLEHFQVTN